MNRQAATVRGLARRVDDLEFGQVSDSRQKGKVRHRLVTALTALVAAMVTKARSLRAVEQRSGEIAARHGRWQGIKGRIADNTFGRLLTRLKLKELVACLHRLIKAEHRRGNLKPTELPMGTIAIDGKNVATLHWHDLCRVLELDPATATRNQVKARLRKEYPEAQLCTSDQQKTYALMRVHTVTLVSSAASVCIHQRPIAGHTNELGSMPALLDELKVAYGRTGLFRLVTMDSGNTSLRATTKITRLGLDYFGQLKTPQGEIYAEAEQELGIRRMSRAHAHYADQQNGHTAEYYAWCHDLTEEGWLDWHHARQLVRVRRVVRDQATGKAISKGERYYVTSLAPGELSARDALKVARAHWRCENGTHWTADAELQEDRRQLAWSRHPRGALAVSLLRMMALAIMAVARQLSRLGYSKETPTWSQVAGHFLLQLCAGILETGAFNDV